MKTSDPIAELTRPFISLCLVLLAGCTSLPMVDVASANQNSRIQFLVLHFTSVPFDESMRLLTLMGERPVSTHYLIPEPGDPTYPEKELKIYRLVPEDQRAWHAGRSFWRGRRSLNGSSIGVEIVNQSFCESREPEAEVQTPEMQECTFYDFPEEQIELVIDLVQDILSRHPEIDAVDIVGHSDVAPTRRLDPGPKFPWRRFAEQGIGAWFDEKTALKYRRRFEEDPPSLDLIRRGLRAYGYRLDGAGESEGRVSEGAGEPETPDLQMRFVLRAFQMHFRPSKTDGLVDAESASILFALLEKYRPQDLEKIQEDGDWAISYR